MARDYLHRPVLATFLSPLAPILLLSGCAPRYLRPDIPVPPSYRGEAGSPAVAVARNGESGKPAETGSLGELRWQDLIHDEELQKLLREALANNYDGQIAAARVLEPAHAYGDALGPFPRSTHRRAITICGLLKTSAVSRRAFRPKATSPASPRALVGNSPLGTASAMPPRPRGPACWPASKRVAWSSKRW